MLYFRLKFEGGEINAELTEVTRLLSQMGAQIDAQARAVLESEGKNATGNLSASIQHTIDIDDDFNVRMVWADLAPYYNFVERGVRGAINDAKAPDSPFKFGSGTGPKGGLRPAIRQWINDKPLPQWRDRASGRFMSYDGMARLISRKVYLHGIAPTPFLRPAIREHFQMYKAGIERAYSVDLAAAVGVWLKKKTDDFTQTYKL